MEDVVEVVEEEVIGGEREGELEEEMGEVVEEVGRRRWRRW